MNDDLIHQMAQIAHAIASGRYRYTIHGAQQRIARSIHGDEVEDAIASGEIIEDYPQYHYGPACLILGRTRAGRPLHILCSLRNGGRHVQGQRG
jgi:hypothetical protein